MRFSFRLQSVLDWKRNLEEASQIRLAEKTRRLQVKEEEIQGLIHERLEVFLKLSKKLMRGIEVKEYLIYQQFIEDRYQNLLRKEREKKEMTIEIEREREQLVGLMKERKMLERLKEKRFKQFIIQMGRLDQKGADEIVLRQYPQSDQQAIPLGRGIKLLPGPNEDSSRWSSNFTVEE